MQLEVSEGSYFIVFTLLSSSCSCGPVGVLRLADVVLLKRLFVVGLEVECDHVEKHEAANSPISSLVQISSLLKEHFQDEIERAKLRKVDLH